MLIRAFFLNFPGSFSLGRPFGKQRSMPHALGLTFRSCKSLADYLSLYSPALAIRSLGFVFPKWGVSCSFLG